MMARRSSRKPLVGKSADLSNYTVSNREPMQRFEVELSERNDETE